MLPKVDVPIYELELPLSKKKTRYRPFLVKEEKILLMAMESEDENASVLAIKQIISNCCLDDNFDIDSLPLLDLEYMFLQLRARSVGEVVNLQYKCNNKVKDEEGNEKECNHIVPIDVNILDINPEINPNHTNEIKLSDKLGIIMKYPSFKSLELTKDVSEVEALMNVIVDSIDNIYDTENIYYAKDIQKKELVDFVESLTQDQFKKIQNFFDTLPKIKKELKFECGKCGYNEEIEVEGIQNFFV